MKGDGNIKKIKIKYINVGLGDSYQVNVKIFDKNNRLVYTGKSYNGFIDVKLKECRSYRIESTFLNEVLNTCIYVYKDYTYYLNFEHSILDNTSNIGTITLLLTDYYYNLPIEKGEIILWQE